MSDVTATRLRRLRKARIYYEEHRHLLGSPDAWRKRLERRQANGLLAAGAVVETSLGLMIDPLRFRIWLLTPRHPEAA